MQLTVRQKEILVGLLLGDGGLEKNGRHTRLRVEHSTAQLPYLQWIRREFGSLLPPKIRVVKQYDARTKKIYVKHHFSTFSLPLFDDYYQEFYKENHKIIPQNISNLLQKPLTLAVWFMDDGYRRSDCNTARINTDCFLKTEQIILQHCLLKNFGIHTKLHKKGTTWNIYIPSKDFKVFRNLVKPLVVPSMQYKLR